MMTHEEFLKIVESYRAFLAPETLEAFKNAIKADRFEPEAQIFILDELHRTKMMMNTLDKAEQEQEMIYKEGLQELETVKKDALRNYKNTRKKAEADSEEADKIRARNLLKTL